MENVAVIERLEKLGLKAAGLKVKELREKQRKMAIAYEHFRYVEEDKILTFGRNLPPGLVLKFTPLNEYQEVPPEPVLMALEAAMEKNCFDNYEITSVIKVPDPILFGRIIGCQDRFFIAQWDDDVKIEDILAPNEG